MAGAILFIVGIGSGGIGPESPQNLYFPSVFGGFGVYLDLTTIAIGACLRLQQPKSPSNRDAKIPCIVPVCSLFLRVHQKEALI